MTQIRTWSVAGALIGACFALVTQAPATWLADAVSRASQQRLVLLHAQGTVWQGSAVALLADGVAVAQSQVLLVRRIETPVTAPAFPYPLPDQVEATIVEADAVVKGQTASSSYKPAILENGVRVMVPPHIGAGTRIVVDVYSQEYVRRAD